MQKSLIALTIAGCISLPAMPQSPTEPEKSESTDIFEKIESESMGNVTFDIPSDIRQKILKAEEHHAPAQGQQSLRPGVNKMNGFRIQVFSDGHNQATLESRAKARGNAIVAKFPKYRGQVYSHSSSPNWYTRVGNFRSQAEASAALSELKRAFPQFASEMRVVKSQIVIIK